ncbi:alpha-1,2-mannosidase, putative [Bacteroides ovatus]|nr:alpha-1,2-mannosidase, putative [Bacteroides ovatus]
MSAWYILNSMGFYQVCPGKPVYSIGRPAFDKAVINLPEGKTFSIVVKNNGKKNKYIESVLLNGKALNIPFFNHQDIANGGTMEIKMDRSSYEMGSPLSGSLLKRRGMSWYYWLFKLNKKTKP